MTHAFTASKLGMISLVAVILKRARSSTGRIAKSSATVAFESARVDVPPAFHQLDPLIALKNHVHCFLEIARGERLNF